MKLRSIKIENFRSIRDLTFEVEKVGGSYTFALIGINESGKSNFLKAVSLVGDVEARLLKTDYLDKGKEIKITLNYEFIQHDMTMLEEETFQKRI